jgi:TRAP-type C4-dicarboxylate transport system substrate-binding protein
MKKRLCRTGCVVLLGIFLFGLFPAAGTAADKPIELKFVTSFSQNRDHVKGFFMFVDRLQKEAGSRVKLVNRGGPEAIPPFEQIEAVRKGIVDFAELSAGYYSAQIPLANGMRLSRLTTAQERENGAYDLFRKVTSDQNIYFLGKFHSSVQFGVYSRVKMESTADFKGKKIRSTPTYKDFLIALGATPITTTHAEIYTALERGLVDAVCSPNFGMLELGWHKKIKYIILPHFYQQDQTIIFNLASWNKLPKDIQQMMDRIMVGVERDSDEFIKGRVTAAREELLKEGIQEITVKDSDHFLKLAYDSAWKDTLSRKPKYGDEMRKLWTYNKEQLQKMK